MSSDGILDCCFPKSSNAISPTSLHATPELSISVPFLHPVMNPWNTFVIFSESSSWTSYRLTFESEYHITCFPPCHLIFKCINRARAPCSKSVKSSLIICWPSLCLLCFVLDDEAFEYAYHHLPTSHATLYCNCVDRALTPRIKSVEFSMVICGPSSCLLCFTFDWHGFKI